jgi:hypothetical protein
MEACVAWRFGVVLAIRGEGSIATGKVVYQLYDPSQRMTMPLEPLRSGSSDLHESGRKMRL